jgi:outer membrane biosynthesis protein TonB
VNPARTLIAVSALVGLAVWASPAQTPAAKQKVEVVKQQVQPKRIVPQKVQKKKQKAKAKPKPKPKKRATATQRRPTAAQCAQITIGMNTIGRDGVIREGVRRGYSTAQVERALRDCGY